MSKKPIKEQDSEADVEINETPKEATKTKSKGRVYTYVGGGEASPNVINFMGRQQFTRGKAAEVTDPQVLAKVAGNPTFVEGEVELEELHDYDAKAAEEANEQRAKDKQTNRHYQKNHKTE